MLDFSQLTIMSDINVYEKFANFGSKMKTLGVISLINILLSLTFFIFPILFFALLGLIFLSFILIFLALKHIKQIGQAIESKLLLSFRSKYITGYILSAIGFFLFIIGYGNILGGQGSFAFSALLAGVGFFFMFIDIVLEMKGWSCLREYFEENQNEFPKELSDGVKKGAFAQKLAVLSLFLWFLILTICLTFVFRALGYLKLGKLKGLRYAQQKVGTPKIHTKVMDTESKEEALLGRTTEEDYCPHCGELIVGYRKFCGKCGSPVSKQ